MSNKPIAVKADQVTPFWSKPPHHRQLKVLLSPAIHGTSALVSLGMVTIPPGESGEPHQHGIEQETWFILSGKGQLKIGEQAIELEPEMVVVAPASVPHQIINDGDEDLKALFIFSPAGPEQQYVIMSPEKEIDP